MPFVAGHAYHLLIYYIEPVKAKYLICIEDNRALFFFINKAPRKFHDINTQLEVTPADLPFLTLPKSYIDTASVKACDVCKLIDDFGPISDGLKEKIKKTVINSNTLRPMFIESILKNF